MYDNKVRLSPDVLEKASLIAEEWGLKNARAAVEAVFRRYADEYLTGRNRFAGDGAALLQPSAPQPIMQWTPTVHAFAQAEESVVIAAVNSSPPNCEAMEALDELLGL